jgi:hypothetical protein
MKYAHGGRELRKRELWIPAHNVAHHERAVASAHLAARLNPRLIRLKSPLGYHNRQTSQFNSLRRHQEAT